MTYSTEHVQSSEEDIPGPFSLCRNRGEYYWQPEDVPEVGDGPVAVASQITPSEPDVENKRDTGFSSNLKESVVDDELLETLTNAATDLEFQSLTELLKGFQEEAKHWCSLHGIDSQEDTLEVLTRQAVFSLYVKATLYEWYHRHGDLPRLSGDPQNDFQLAFEVTENPGFEETVLDEIVTEAPEETIDRVVSERDRLLNSSQPAEDIGQLYEALLDKEDRQVLGQFRTQPVFAKLMRTWAASGDDVVLDPGIGAGVLPSPFHPRWTVSTEPRGVEGIDRSPLSALMGTTALTLYRQEHDITTGDFLHLTPEDLPNVDALVANPPYSSAEILSTEYQEQVNARLTDTTGVDISARSPLYAYFMYHARSFLSPGDRAAFLTPPSFLVTEYGRPLKQFLVEEFDIRAFVQFDVDGDEVFPNAETSAVFTCLKAAGDDTPSTPVRFITFAEVPDLLTIRQAINNGQQGKTAWGKINQCHQSELHPSNNWQAHFSLDTLDTDRLTELGDLLRVSRGKSTGDVDFFCLTQTEVNEIEIDEQHLTKVVRRPSDLNGYDFQGADWDELQKEGNDVWLLDPDHREDLPESIHAFARAIRGSNSVNVDIDADDSGNLRSYLRQGIIRNELHSVGCIENRQPWYRPRRQPPAKVLVHFASRDDFRFILNDAGVRHINNLYGLYDEKITEEELHALLAYLNSDLCKSIMNQYALDRSDGFTKIRISDIETLPVIDPRDLPAGKVTRLAELFDEIRETARRGVDCSNVQVRIEEVLEDVL